MSSIKPPVSDEMLLSRPETYDEAVDLIVRCESDRRYRFACMMPFLVKDLIVCVVLFAVILICSKVSRRPVILEAFSPLIGVFALAGLFPVFGLMRLSRQIRDDGSFFVGKKSVEIIEFGQEVAENYNTYLRSGRSLFFLFRFRRKK